VVSSARAAIRTGGDVWSSGYRFRRKDGTYALETFHRRAPVPLARSLSA
jgi:hypothetical protein